METQKFIKSGLIAVTSIGMIFTSCSKSDEDTSLAQNYSTTEQTGNDLDGISDEGNAGTMASYKTDDATNVLTGGATISKDSICGDTAKITVDFGSSNYACKDGRNRRGKVIIRRVLKKGWNQISTDGYYVNDVKVEGTRTVQWSVNGAFHPVATITATHTITLADGSVITDQSARVREWTEGYKTPMDRTDDVFSVTGSGTGTTKAGDAFTITVTTALIRKASCHQFVSGVIEMDVTGKQSRKIDFGDGTCDDNATITVGKTSKKVVLK